MKELGLFVSVLLITLSAVAQEADVSTGNAIDSDENVRICEQDLLAMLGVGPLDGDQEVVIEARINDSRSKDCQAGVLNYRRDANKDHGYLSFEVPRIWPFGAVPLVFKDLANCSPAQGGVIFGKSTWKQRNYFGNVKTNSRSLKLRVSKSGHLALFFESIVNDDRDRVTCSGPLEVRRVK